MSIVDYRSEGLSGVDLVRHNDLFLVAGHAERLIAAGIDSLDAIFALESNKSFDKPGLDPWRERLSIRLPGDGSRVQSTIDNRSLTQSVKDRPSTICPEPQASACGIDRIVYIKRFLRPPRRAAREVTRARCGAKSFAGLEWTWLREFVRCGIPAAEPLAFGEERRRGREARSAVVIAAAPGESLEKWVQRDGWPDRATRRRLLYELADLTARMHAHGLAHRDLYLSHVFFDPNAPVGASLRLIDLQRVLRPRTFPTRWFVKDLAALNYSTPPDKASRADRLRFLACYLAERLAASTRSADEPEPNRRLLIRRWFYRVVGKTEQIARHDRSRRRRHGGL